MYAILFDIDGTLVNTRGAGRAALSAGFEAAFGWRDEKPIDASGRTDRSIARDLFASHGVEDTDENWNKLMRGYLEHLPRCLIEREGCVLPGVVELLGEVASRENLLVGLLTGNTPEGARLKLAHFGIWSYFPFGAYGDVHLDRNSVAADALRHVRARGNGAISPDRILVIGDTPHDIACARHIGARSVAVVTGWHTKAELAAAKPDAMRDDLSDAAAVLSLFS